MIIIRNDGSVCCRTSDENNLCNRCREKYREDDQSDMLVMPVVNYSSDKKPVPNYRGQGVDEILFGSRSRWAEASEGEVESDFVKNADDDLDQEDMLEIPRMRY
jgi:hypothetical protein